VKLFRLSSDQPSRRSTINILPLPTYSEERTSPKQDVSLNEKTRALSLLVVFKPMYAEWWDSAKVLWSPGKVPLVRNGSYFLRRANSRRSSIAGRSLGASLLLHCSMVFLLFYSPLAFSSSDPSTNPVSARPRIVYYSVPIRTEASKLPDIVPSGPGGRPGNGRVAALLPVVGSTTVQRQLTVISAPRPDNVRQTIIQPVAPPDLRIKIELSLPNLVLGRATETPQLPLESQSNVVRPIQAKHQLFTEPVPSMTQMSPEMRPNTSLTTSDFQIRMPVDPNASAPKPVAARLPSAEKTVPSIAEGNPEIAPTSLAESSGPPALPLAVGTAATLTRGKSQQANVSVPSLALEMPSGPADAVPGTSGVQMRLPAPSGTSASQGDNSLTSISVTPAPPQTQIALPLGNRAGEFSISPNGEKPGSENGAAHGLANGGKGEGGAGGDRSTGKGPGETGGGNPAAVDGTLSIKGGSGEDALGPELAPEMVYPVPTPSPLRRNAVVVSAGSSGGGGLSVYGALQCGSIYTVFLPMPGGSWTLQYCDPASRVQSTQLGTRSTVVHLEQALLPPDVTSMFDFRRLPVPVDKAHKMIVLKGVIEQDGTVVDLHIFQGILPKMDEAARAAFSRWTFKPAMRDGKPVKVEILVGIPPQNQPGTAIIR
jgi:hypothetical protein